MERNTTLWIGAYALLAVLELTGEFLDNRSLILYTKPFLMPVLAIWMVRRTPGIRRFLRQTVLAGLLFATLGDVFLMFAGGEYDALFFLLGLGAFLTTQACYLGGYLSEVNLRTGYLRKQPWLVAVFVLFLSGFLVWLWSGIPEGLRLPVAVYGTIITAMALGALNWRGQVQPGIFVSLIAGALLFMLSDCLIAAARFGHPFAVSRIAVMATYLLGQWLIVRAVAERLRQVPVRQKK